jgi:hypothetical protein
MVIEGGSFKHLGLPAPQANPFGDFYWDFQKTFPYAGGDLGILFTHPSSDQPNPPLIDCVTNMPAAGAFLYSMTYQAVTGVSTNWTTITRIHYGYGAGCPGSGGMVPNLVQSNDVTSGGSMSFGVANAPPGAVAIYVVGASTANVGLPNGCTALTNPTMLFPVVLSARGRNAFPASFPPGLSLKAYAQVFVRDAGAPGGWSATNGVMLTVSP